MHQLETKTHQTNKLTNQLETKHINLPTNFGDYASHCYKNASMYHCEHISLHTMIDTFEIECISAHIQTHQLLQLISPACI